MDAFVFQVNYKIGDDLINVRGDHAGELDENLKEVEGLADQIKSTGQALRGAARNTAEAVAMIQAGLPGSVVIGTYDGPPQSTATYQAPAAATYRPPVSSAYCDTCKTAPVCATCDRPCNARKSIKDGKWWVHDCPSGERSHKGIWCNAPK